MRIPSYQSDDRQLMCEHIAALFSHDDRGRMTYVNEPGGQRAPRFFLGRTRDGVEWRVRDDLEDPELLRELQAACESGAFAPDASLQPEASTRFEEILGRSAPIERMWTGPAFSFPQQLLPNPRSIRVTHENAFVLRAHLEPWLPDVELNQPLFAVLHEGEAVAVCCSVRRTRAAHEVGVETAPAFRGRGLAGDVVAAWARAVRELGARPLYSTSWTNVASQSVARKLNLKLFGSDLHIT